MEHSYASPSPPSVAVVDDDASVLRSIERLLKSQGIEPRPYRSARQLLDDLDDIDPNCIIADLSMPDVSGLELQEMLAERHGQCPMVFITGLGDIRSSVRAMRLGAVDFLEKPFTNDELLSAVGRALDQDRATRDHSRQLQTTRNALDNLTKRERQVFEQVVLGRLNKQIAADLEITEKTVKVHRARVMRKMGVRSVARLARIAEQIETSDAV